MSLRRRGLALIVAAGVLGILAILATAFAVLTQMERRSSRQRLHATQALLLARGGIEEAVARLRGGQDPSLPETTYRGEDWDDDGLVTGIEAAAEVHQPGKANLLDCPVRHALRPSFYVRHPSDLDAHGLRAPARTTVEGRDRGWSGNPTPGGHHALAIFPEGGIWLNGGNPAVTSDPTATSDYNTQLRRVLGVLARAVDEQAAPAGDGLPVSWSDGWGLIDARPASGWTSWDQVRDLALGGSDAKLASLRPYITLQAWADLRVIRPNLLPMGSTDWGRMSWADLLLDHASLDPLSTAPDFERVGGKVVGRAPVDLRWARRQKPLLVALLAGLSGRYLMDSTGIEMGTTATVDIPYTDTSTDLAHRIADQILAYPGPLDTWAQWNAFCDTLNVNTPNAQLRKGRRDLLKAHFNPNTDFNKFNPNPVAWRSVDKSDLYQYSTEFSLLPLCAYRIASSGVLSHPDGKVLARHTLEAVLDGPSVVRLSTQRELVCENLGSLDLAGDESGVRLPGHPRFVTPSRGSVRTWGHRLDTTALYPGGWMDGDSQGASLQSYPEPCANPGPGPMMTPSDWDGNLQLATLETAQGDRYGVDAPPNSMMLLARYDDGLDLDEHAGPTWLNLTDTSQITTANLSRSLFHKATPSNLYPDGCFSERYRTPAYYDAGNANGLHGLISFWVKPSSVGKAASNNFLNPYLRWSNLRESVFSGHGSRNQFFWLGASNNTLYKGFSAQFDTGHETDDTDREHQFLAPENPVPLRQWRLISLYYDLEAPDPDSVAELCIDDGTLAGSANGYSVGQAHDLISDLTLPDITGAHRLILGNRHDLPSEYRTSPPAGVYNVAYANATLDEFAIYDFGQQESSCATFAKNRFQDGRYHKGTEYTTLPEAFAAPKPDQAAGYLSGLVNLPGGRTLLAVAWTWLAPTGMDAFQPYPEVALATAAGDAYLDGTASGGPASRAVLAPGWSPSRPWWRPSLEIREPFRLHVAWRAVTPVPPGTALTESPVLDDLTLLHEPAGGPCMRAWTP